MGPLLLEEQRIKIIFAQTFPNKIRIITTEKWLVFQNWNATSLIVSFYKMYCCPTIALKVAVNFS